LTEKDFLPPHQCQFQHWGDRDGEPYCHVRPLSESAAERIWRRTAALAAADWATAGGPRDTNHSLDLAECGEWDALFVKNWLLSRVPDPDQPVFVCYQPKIAVSVPWRVVCDHWLVFFWTGGCVWPASEQWILVHDGDRFAFGRRRD
jgi:hypothetical protein